jgi:ankyrin repeat protein
MICVAYIYKDGWTPLMTSVDKGNMEICKLLMDNGALPSINTPDNVNILYNINVFLFFCCK